MSMKAIPSLGVMTPLESTAKGGSAKELVNFKNITNDFTGVISKPSSVVNSDTLLGKGEDSTRSRSVAEREKDEVATNKSTMDTNAWLNWTPSRSTGLQV
ncbi:MAG: hypothetical protein [Caudoviricetes sp.]|nr:MAG: hypothetical protein [Caudoviricetes sp.]